MARFLESFFFSYLFLPLFKRSRYAVRFKSLTKSKQKYLALLINDKDIEANTRYFKGKQTQLLKYEKDDARFLPYYSVLVSALSSSSQSATLDSIEIDKNRDATFIVKFKDYDGMVQFLRYVESEEFLSNFEALSMASLNLSRSSGSTTKSSIGGKQKLSVAIQRQV